MNKFLITVLMLFTCAAMTSSCGTGGTIRLGFSYGEAEAYVEFLTESARELTAIRGPDCDHAAKLLELAAAMSSELPPSPDNDSD
jgi:hypothetical protein